MWRPVVSHSVRGGTRSSRRQFLAFVITGGVAAGVNVMSRIGFSTFLRFEYAILAAYAIGMLTAYLLAHRYVFLGDSRGCWAFIRGLCIG